jgi:hypothetical protein
MRLIKPESIQVHKTDPNKHVQMPFVQRSLKLRGHRIEWRIKL